MEYKGIAYLKNKLACRQSRVRTRYRYYEMKNSVEHYPDEITLEHFRGLNPVLGWCSKAVDSVADRIVFNGFKNDGFYFNEIYGMNSSDVLFENAILSALISSCCFIYISADENGYPRLQVIDGGNATGIIDPVTQMLTEGYAVLERDLDSGSPTLEAYFTKGCTTFYESGKEPYSIRNKAPYALLVPIINRPDAVRPFGHSRISRACMELTQEALRTVRRSEISAEFYSFPQKYVLGLSQKTKIEDKWGATIASFLTFGKDQDGDKPVVGQFAQQSMAPFTEQLKMFAGLFAGETGLTLDDLGFPTANPSSSEAIQAGHEMLKATVKKAQRDFSVGFVNAGFLAACIRDKYEYRRSAFRDVGIVWKPIFDINAANLASVGDSISKIGQVIPGAVDETFVKEMFGIETGGTANAEPNA